MLVCFITGIILVGFQFHSWADSGIEEDGWLVEELHQMEVFEIGEKIFSG